MTSTTSSPQQFFDDIFGKRVFQTDSRDVVYPTKCVFRGGVDFLIFPLIITAVSFILLCFTWFFDQLTDYFFNMIPRDCCAVFALPFLLGPIFASALLAIVLGIAVAACLLVRWIASVALFLIGLPFFFAYNAYVDSRPVTTTPQNAPATSIYNPPAQQTNQGQNPGDYSASAPPSYDQVVAQTLQGTYYPNPY